MQIIILRYLDPDSLAMAGALEAHRAFLNRHLGSGDFVCNGALEEKKGEVIIARRKTHGDLGKIMEKEPFVACGAATFELLAFNPSAYADGFHKFL